MASNKRRFAILKNEMPDDHLLWIAACNAHKDYLEFDVIELLSHTWLEQIIDGRYDCLLAKPSCLSSRHKQLYDERILVLSSLNLPVYPSPMEIYIYENKRFLYSWLKAHNLPHPETHVIYERSEAENFIEKVEFPLIVKANIGASGSGVQVLKTKIEARSYVQETFSSKGVPRRWGPNFAKGQLAKRGFHYILHPSDIKRKVSVYKTVKSDKQKGFVIFQEYIPHDFEWRIVAINNSYFAHKKLKAGEKASGSLLKNYDNPPTRLFDFAKNIMVKFNFFSQAIDAFETKDGRLIINEMQCLFGQSDPYQMLVDGKPGRYLCKKGVWIFEAGHFNSNESYDLRVKAAMDLLGDASQ